MSFLDNYASNGEFPFPADAAPLRTDLAAGEKDSYTLKSVPFVLKDIRAKDGIGKDGDRLVINIRAKAELPTYLHTGEVSFWFGRGDFDPATARGGEVGARIAREQAAMLANLFVACGMSAPEDWELGENPDGETICNKLFQAVSKGVLTGRVTFKASLHWENRAYVNRDGNLVVHKGDAEMRYISSVQREADEETPF